MSKIALRGLENTSHLQQNLDFEENLPLIHHKIIQWNTSLGHKNQCYCCIEQTLFCFACSIGIFSAEHYGPYYHGMLGYIASWQRNVYVNDLPRVVTWHKTTGRQMRILFRLQYQRTTVQIHQCTPPLVYILWLLTQSQVDCKILGPQWRRNNHDKQFPRFHCAKLPGVLCMGGYFLSVSLNNTQEELRIFVCPTHVHAMRAYLRTYVGVSCECRKWCVWVSVCA